MQRHHSHAHQGWVYVRSPANTEAYILLYTREHATDAHHYRIHPVSFPRGVCMHVPTAHTPHCRQMAGHVHLNIPLHACLHTHGSHIAPARSYIWGYRLAGVCTQKHSPHSSHVLELSGAHHGVRPSLSDSSCPVLYIPSNGLCRCWRRRYR